MKKEIWYNIKVYDNQVFPVDDYCGLDCERDAIFTECKVTIKKNYIELVGTTAFFISGSMFGKTKFGRKKGKMRIYNPIITYPNKEDSSNPSKVKNMNKKELAIKKDLFFKNGEFKPLLTPKQYKVYVKHIEYVMMQLRRQR